MSCSGRILSSLLLCAVALFLCVPAASAQTRPGLVSFERVAVPDDVPAHIVTVMAQDARGLIWAGTQDGLVSYDGYGFKVYQPKPGDAGSLGGSYVRALTVARDGRLWVGTISDGLSVFDPKSERFTRYRHDVKDPDSLAHDRIEGIAEDRDGRYWLATDDGLDRFDPASGKFEHFRHDEHDASSLSNNQVRSLLFDRNGVLWVGTYRGLQKLGPHGFEHIAADSSPDSLADQPVTRLFQDNRGQIWIGTAKSGAAVLSTDGKLHWLRPALPPSPEGLSHFWIYSIAEVGNEIWLATFGGGVDVVDPVSFKVIDRLRHDGSSATIGGDRVGALLVDRSGLVWAGAWGGGLAWHNPAARAFLMWRNNPADPEGPTHDAVVRMLETANGELWLGTNGKGIDVMDESGHLQRGFRPGAAKAGALADGSITCMAQGADATIWVATLDGTLHRMRPGRHEFERLGEQDGLPAGPIRTMAFGRDGALWVGALKGMARIDARDGHITAYSHSDGDERSLAGHSVESLAFTPDGTLWVGTEDGLNAFDTASGTAQRIRHDDTRADSLPDNWVPDMMVAHDGKLWLATQSGVAILEQWDGHAAHFDVLGPRLHLPAHPADSLIEDGAGQVWLGSRIRIDPKTWHHRSYGPADGNQFRSLYIASRIRTRDGRLLFGSPEGALVVRPDLLSDWTYEPGVVASGISVEGKPQAGAATLDNLALGPDQRNLRLEFAALDFSAPQKLHYRYRLEGYDGDWVEVGAGQRIAAYTGLPPGSYRLRVQGSNRNGQWSPHELHLAVTVAPAWYQTWWSRSLLVLACLLAIFAVFRLRLRQLRLRSERLEQAVAERTIALETAYRRIEEASLTDPLTQLRNRRFLEQTIQADFDMAARKTADGASDADLVLLMLDLDHFKQVNDIHGHAAGDAVLVQTALLLKQCMRASDYVVRWGGEEFLLVARFIERKQAPALAEKIRATVEAHPFILPDGQQLKKTVSIGFAAYPFNPAQPAAMTLDTLQRLADVALYAAKRSWRNAWVGVGARARGDVAAELAVEQFLADAKAAVADGRVEVTVSAADGAGLRWE